MPASGSSSKPAKRIPPTLSATCSPVPTAAPKTARADRCDRYSQRLALVVVLPIEPVHPAHIRIDRIGLATTELLLKPLEEIVRPAVAVWAYRKRCVWVRIRLADGIPGVEASLSSSAWSSDVSPPFHVAAFRCCSMPASISSARAQAPASSGKRCLQLLEPLQCGRKPLLCRGEATRSRVWNPSIDHQYTRAPTSARSRRLGTFA